jgi:hypothetical protein
VLFLFEFQRGRASDGGEVSLSELIEVPEVQEASRSARQITDSWAAYLEEAREKEPATVREIEKVLRDSGLMELTGSTGTASLPEFLPLLVRRHQQVQAGKFDRGQPKGPWLRLSPDGSRVLLTAQRFQLQRRDRPRVWTDVARHPYRTRSAQAFVAACPIA